MKKSRISPPINRIQGGMNLNIPQTLPGLLFDKAYLTKIEDRIYDRAVSLSVQGQKIVGLYCAVTPK